MIPALWSRLDRKRAPASAHDSLSDCSRAVDLGGGSRGGCLPGPGLALYFVPDETVLKALELAAPITDEKCATERESMFEQDFANAVPF